MSRSEKMGIACLIMGCTEYIANGGDRWQVWVLVVVGYYLFVYGKDKRDVLP